MKRIVNIIYRFYKKSFSMNGRDNRKQYLTTLAFQIILACVYSLYFVGEDNRLSLIAIAILLIPLLSSNIRRLHDGGYSGAICFGWLIVPYLVIIASAFIRSEPRENKYGPPEE